MRTLKITKIITEQSIKASEELNEECEITMPHLRLGYFDRVGANREICFMYQLKKMSDEKVREKLSCLTDCEREVMQMLIGHGCVSRSVNEVADKLLLTPSYVRQIREKALAKINTPKD